VIPELKEMWRRVLSGDASAWQKLIEAYAALVFTVARRAGLNDSDAEDCVQDVWLTLYRTKRTLKDAEAIPAWLIRTTHRRAVGIQQRSRRAKERDADSHIESAKLPDHELLQLEREFLLRRAIQQLDPKCRTLIESLYSENSKLSYQQAAKAIGITPNGLGPLRARCLAKLSKILKELGIARD